MQSCKEVHKLTGIRDICADMPGGKDVSDILLTACVPDGVNKGYRNGFRAR